mgnify:CR=1 FL=1
MRAEVYEDGDRDLVFVLGWTNKPEYTNIRWLIDHLTDAGYRVHAVEIPRVVSDFDAEYLDPVAAYVADLGEYRFLGHSTGGLIGAFLDEPAPTTRVYLSPWWGFNEGLTGPLLSLLMRIPTRRTIVPAPFTGDMLGDLARPDQVEDLPDGIAPTFLREGKRAQERLPPFDPEAGVFYTPQDPIGSGPAISERTPEANAVVYEGGHDLFNSSAREAHLETLLAAVGDGVDALR